MDHTITVRGVGRVRQTPDRAELSLTLTGRDPDYDRAMAQAAGQLDALTAGLEGLGFAPEDLKTGSLSVAPEYESVCGPDGSWRNAFKGYCITHTLELAFGLDTALLGRVLAAVSASGAQPELSIRFTVADAAGLSDALLADAARNARQQAETLARASGAALGELVSIRCGAEEPAARSETVFTMEKRYAGAGANLTPRDTELTASAVFVWQLA